MPDPSPSHGAVYAVALAHDLLAQGFSEHQVFEGTGLRPQVLQAEIPVASFASIAALFEHAADLTGNDLIGFQRGMQRDTRMSGLIAYVGSASPTLGDSIRNLARYRRVFSDAMEMDLAELDSKGIAEWFYAVPTSVPRRQHLEFAAAGFMGSIRQSTGRRITPRLVTFRHGRKNHVKELEKFFGCEVRFHAARNSFHFKISDLDLPLITADDQLYKVLVGYCQDVLARKARNAPDLVVQIERAIVDRLASGEATQESVANAVAMSPRTLSRRLTALDTSFFKILEDMRLSLATNYLRQSSLALSEISFLLGYSGLSAFNEAFKRWTGKTPGQYRKA